MIRINIFGLISYSERQLSKYEIDITNITNVYDIQNKLSNMIDSCSWEIPKRYILESVSSNLDKYIKSREEPKEIVIKSKIFEKIKSKSNKIKEQTTQLSLFD